MVKREREAQEGREAGGVREGHLCTFFSAPPPRRRKFDLERTEKGYMNPEEIRGVGKIDENETLSVPEAWDG